MDMGTAVMVIEKANEQRSKSYWPIECLLASIRARGSSREIARLRGSVAKRGWVDERRHSGYGDTSRSFVTGFLSRAIASGAFTGDDLLDQWRQTAGRDRIVRSVFRFAEGHGNVDDLQERDFNHCVSERRRCTAGAASAAYATIYPDGRASAGGVPAR